MLKRIQKIRVFDHFRKYQLVKFAKKSLKFTTRQYWIRFACFFHWKTLFLQYFLVWSKVLLYQSRNIICPFSVMLKHKWYWIAPKGQYGENSYIILFCGWLPFVLLVELPILLPSTLRISFPTLRSHLLPITVPFHSRGVLVTCMHNLSSSAKLSWKLSGFLGIVF